MISFALNNPLIHSLLLLPKFSLAATRVGASLVTLDNQKQNEYENFRSIYELALQLKAVKGNQIPENSFVSQSLLCFILSEMNKKI